ncbi:unnamed protein product [Clavelina lepadiformis]|uniref:WD repeat-containing protein 97 n=1 Tax=Clavelina lepadiformis TaxID=159417 RepID=A0ABP0FZ09_CLALP
MVDRAESRIGTADSSQPPSPIPPWQQKNSLRAKQLWDLLRRSVKLSTDLVKKADVLPSTVSHGVHHIRKINHDEEILDIAYNPTSEEFITVDQQFIRIFFDDGRRKDIIDLGESIRRLILCTQSNQYVTLTSLNEMKLFSSEFELLSAAKAQYKINCLMYNESTNEVVTAGPGNVVTWCFRYGNRYLIPHRVITEGLTCKDTFDKITLENTQSNSQRCYAVCGTGVAVFNLFHASLLIYKKDLHVRNITSILFFNPLKYIVTGSRDGSIKLWDEDFHIQLVFVGHHGPVSSLQLYPQGPYIMSTSHDASIRVWSLETRDEVDLIKMDDPVLGLGTIPHNCLLFSYSTYTVDLWTITHVHQIFTTIGSRVQKLKMSSYYKLVDRVVCQSEDGTIRLISPVDGTVITTVLPSSAKLTIPSIESSASRSTSTASSKRHKREEVSLIDAVYCLPFETVFAAFSNGNVVRASTIVNPAQIRSVWKFEKGEKPNCLCLYEYILNTPDLQKTWEDVKAGVNVRKKKGNKPEYGNKMVLLVGRKDGCIASLDMVTGKVLFKTEAHGAKGVIGLLSNVRNDQVVSAGRDNVVKVWKMFPHTNDALGLLMSFYCAHTPLHMIISGTRLAVAFQQVATATYTVVMYDLQSKERYDHSPNYDHTDQLTGLACCPRLKLFASASRDGTIKIWNDVNALVRLLKINEEPKSIAFSTQRGDLLIGLGRNVHLIEHTNYLPRMFLFKMVCMEFPTLVKEEALPLKQEVLATYEDNVVRKVTVAKSSYMKMDYAWDPMTNEEQEKLSEEEQERRREFALLSARDAELEKIRDGVLKPKRASRKPSKRAESLAFKKYMTLFYNRPKKLNIPDEDDFDPDPPFVRHPTPEVWQDEMKIGFFPPIKEAKPVKDILDGGVEKEKHWTESGPNYDPVQKYIINPCGFIPNSILIKLLWPQDQVKKIAEETYKPPMLSEEQMEMLQQMNTNQGIISPSQEGDDDALFLTGSESSTFEDEQRVLDFGDEGGAIEPSSGLKKQTTRKKNKAKAVEKKPSALMEKMRKAMETPPPPPKEPTPPPTLPPPEQPKIKVPTRPTKPIVKFVSRPPPPKDPTPPPPTPPPPTPPPTPPPNYLTQFEGLPWYERHKDYIIQRLLKPYSALQFFNVLCDVMGISIDWDHRCGIVNALLLLWQQEGIAESRHVVASMGAILNASVPPTAKEPNQAQYLRVVLKLYQTVNGGSDDFVIELLTNFLEGDQHHRSYIRSILIEQGLQDPHQFLKKELESWEVWKMDETRALKPQMRDMVQRWFEDWKTRFKNHIDQTLEQLKRGDVRGKIRRPGLSKTAEGGKRVQFAIPDGSRTVAAMEVVNYFCEIMVEEELERVRLANLKPEPTKNTVLVLPKLEGKQAIVRLGEMHTARRVRERLELAVEYKLNPLLRPYPDLLAAFTNKLHLPANRVHMNPFPSEIDKYDEMSDMYQPILLTLKSAAHQKYFIPERSYVHMA